MANGARHVTLLGGCGGIGRALTQRAVSDGWRVTVLDLPASLERHPPPGSVSACAVDLGDQASVGSAFDGLGPMDGFVNLAGFMTRVQPIEETSLDEFDEAMTGNFRGAFLAAKAALPLLRLGRSPSMVNIVSGLANHVRPGYGPYGAAKAGIVHLTKTLALEAAPDIRVNAVGPAAVDTAFLRGGTGRSNEDQATQLDVEAYARMTPLARMATPDDVVGPIMFLLGSDSQFMTGQVLWVNGGGFMP
jgi:NAD(P)-dependent dehydrogenase (short-subunit alcohol dehydrogenase family)